MSITKWYEVCCDKCGVAINHYSHYKPSIKQLREDCGRIRINNGKVIITCKGCVEEETKAKGKEIGE